MSVPTFDVRQRLRLAPSPRRLVFRALVDRLKRDPQLARVVGLWQTWDGDPNAANAPAKNKVTVRVTPACGPMAWYDESSQSGPLLLVVEATVPGFAADDVLDLWYAIERALFPATNDALLAFQAALVAAGASIGLITFTAPASITGKDDEAGSMTATGHISIDVRIST